MRFELKGASRMRRLLGMASLGAVVLLVGSSRVDAGGGHRGGGLFSRLFPPANEYTAMRPVYGSQQNRLFIGGYAGYQYGGGAFVPSRPGRRSARMPWYSPPTPAYPGLPMP